jgi:hypothetical protein
MIQLAMVRNNCTADNRRGFFLLFVVCGLLAWLCVFAIGMHGLQQRLHPETWLRVKSYPSSSWCQEFHDGTVWGQTALRFATPHDIQCQIRVRRFDSYVNGSALEHCQEILAQNDGNFFPEVFIWYFDDKCAFKDEGEFATSTPVFWFCLILGAGPMLVYLIYLVLLVLKLVIDTFRVKWQQHKQDRYQPLLDPFG